MKKNRFLFLRILATWFCVWRATKKLEIVTVDNERLLLTEIQLLCRTSKSASVQLKNFRQIKRVPPQSISSQMD